MRIFITGYKGQLGRALYQALADHTLEGADLPELDITDRAAISAAIARFTPDAVIHTAAWTNVDGCAKDPDEAYRANALGTQSVALACAAQGCAMLHVSTNEVFDGAASLPYREWQAPNPINAYGSSKAAGEWYVRHLLTRFYIVRTAWLYAAGGRNFPHRMLQLADDVRAGKLPALRVVTDEVSNPTYTPDLAEALARLVQSEAYGVYHLTNEGYCSRYDFACAILALGGRSDAPVEPISLAEFQRASTPPPFAPLANTAAAALGICLRSWRDALAEFLQDVA
ncbi:MAG: dTDP-4-dehydrorhamnose reductase [Anaerolineales bacterium]|nr:dTDP-4-dehydrorhamnose reductase [Anaerolineales bacterium]